MRLSAKALAVSGGILWGGAILLTGILNLLWPSYGEHFLLMVSSIYPGYHGTRTLGDVLIGTGYGLVDGSICFFLLGWIYNFFVPGEGNTT